VVQKEKTPQIRHSEEIQEIQSGTQGNLQHWSDVPGSVPLLRSLLAREVVSARDSEMSEWFMAVIEDVEHEVAQTRNSMAFFGNETAEDILNSLATRMFIAGRKGFNASES